MQDHRIEQSDTGADQVSDPRVVTLQSLRDLEHARFSSLLDAARASVAAADAGHSDPTEWIRTWLEDEGLLPGPGVPPEQVAAQACCLQTI